MGLGLMPWILCHRFHVYVMDTKSLPQKRGMHRHVAILKREYVTEIMNPKALSLYILTPHTLSTLRKINTVRWLLINEKNIFIEYLKTKMPNLPGQIPLSAIVVKDLRWQDSLIRIKTIRTLVQPSPILL